ncbi:MAG: GNAT family N-acetyltransferase [Ruminococcus sp.]|nr:GNAT family N-acetyltransferase [Ruminococcus sp.]MDE6785401.1 GNAT family N-acetyltransferase [Ruminococcus sp.]
MSAIFTTGRLIIRKFVPDDSDDLAEILTDKEVTYFEPYETFKKEACVQEAINFSKSNEFFAVVLNDKVIGKIYFSERDHGSYEIGYTFNRNYQGKGHAYESVKGMIKYAFECLKVRRIFAEINSRNGKSVRLVEKLKMRKEAEFLEFLPREEDTEIFDNMYVYALLRNEYVK